MINTAIRINHPTITENLRIKQIDNYKRPIPLYPKQTYTTTKELIKKEVFLL